MAESTLSRDDDQSPQQRFGRLAGAFADRPGVTLPDESSGRRFGSTALKVDGSIFAMLIANQVVVKLPRSRVTALIEAGTGLPFISGRGSPMKEWLTVTDSDDDTWHSLAEEALAFVRSAAERR